MTKADFIRRVRGCERRLYRVARTMLPSEADCEDAVQEALLRAWDRLDTLREEAYFETWLMRIVINQCRTFYRRRPPAPAQLTEDIPGPEGGDTALLEALALSFADNTDAKLETMMEALSSGGAGNKNGWLGFNRFLDSNIRPTKDMQGLRRGTETSAPDIQAGPAEGTGSAGENEKRSDRRGGGSDRFANRIEFPGWNS